MNNKEENNLMNSSEEIIGENNYNYKGNKYYFYIE